MAICVDLFDGLKQCSPEEQAILAALLEIGPIECASIAPEPTRRLPKIFTLFKKNEAAGQTSPEAMLEQAKCRFLALTAEKRMERLRAAVAERACHADPLSGPHITVAVLRAVAKKHNIDPYLTPCVLVKQIMAIKFRQMGEDILSRWDNLSAENRLQFDRELEKHLVKMPRETQDELRNALSLSDLSPQALRESLFALSAAVDLSDRVNVAKWQASIAVSVVCHSILTTALGGAFSFTAPLFLSSAHPFFPGAVTPFGSTTASSLWIAQSRKLNRELIDAILFAGIARSLECLNALPENAGWCASPSEKTAFDADTESIHCLEQNIAQTRTELARAQADQRRLNHSVAETRQELIKAETAVRSARTRVAGLESTLANAYEQLDACDEEDVPAFEEHIARLKTQIFETRRACMLTERELDIWRRKAADDLPAAELDMTGLARRIATMESRLHDDRTQLDSIHRNRTERMRQHLTQRTPRLIYSSQVIHWFTRQSDLGLSTEAENALVELNEGIYQTLKGKALFGDTECASFGNGYRIYYTYTPETRQTNIVRIGHQDTETNDFWDMARPKA